jgi:hypothetical protein
VIFRTAPHTLRTDSGRVKKTLLADPDQILPVS